MDVELDTSQSLRTIIVGALKAARYLFLLSLFSLFGPCTCAVVLSARDARGVGAKPRRKLINWIEDAHRLSVLAVS